MNTRFYLVNLVIHLYNKSNQEREYPIRNSTNTRGANRSIYSNSKNRTNTGSRKVHKFNSQHNGPSHSSAKRGRRSLKSNIHPSKFIHKAVEQQTDDPYIPNNSFADFALHPQTKSNLAKIGYETPTPIQDQSIDLALKGHDVIGLANTGTGKTAAFLLPTIEKLRNSRSVEGVLILAPTRELAQQIEQEFRIFSEGQRLYSVLVVGGMNIGRQINQIKRGPHFIIGTPGRVMDLVKRGALSLGSVEVFILDEADRMCDMGFSKDIRSIAQSLPNNRQTLCFSATMTSDVNHIVHEFMNNPETISVMKEQRSDHIEQNVVYASGSTEKADKLQELLESKSFEKVIVFGETKHGVQRLSDNLNKSGLKTTAIHGNKSQSQRRRALQDFKDGRSDVLIATDVAARGLDIPNVSHVINFDLPQTYSDYIHRIGRTGRAGNSGHALTFVAENKRGETTIKSVNTNRGVPKQDDSTAITTKRRRIPSSRDTEKKLVALANS